jgi:DNA-binding Lrp family transcriptional regulator
MPAKSTIEYVEACATILKGLGLPKAFDEKNRQIFELILDGKEYSEIAEILDISLPTVKDRCRRRLWENLSLYFGTKVSRSNIVGLLDGYLNGVPISSSSASNTAWPLEIVANPPKFVGRNRELVELDRLARSPGIGVLLGQPEIGKTALVAQYIHTQKRLSTVIWQTIESGCSVRSISEAMGLTVEGEDDAEYVNAIVDCLQKKQYLLVLDQAETLLASAEGKGLSLSLSAFSPEYKAYDTLIKLLTRRSIQSSIFLLSRLEFRDLTRARNNGFPVNILQIRGLGNEDVKQLMHLYQVEVQDYERLCELYQGHPGLLRDALNQISTLYDGNVEDFLKATVYLSTSIRETYEGILGHLNSEQIAILALLKSSLSFHELVEAANQAGINVGKGKMAEILEMLEKIQLVDVVSDGGTLKKFSANGVALKYLSNVRR